MRVCVRVWLFFFLPFVWFVFNISYLIATFKSLVFGFFFQRFLKRHVKYHDHHKPCFQLYLYWLKHFKLPNRNQHICNVSWMWWTNSISNKTYIKRNWLCVCESENVYSIISNKKKKSAVIENNTDFDWFGMRSWKVRSIKTHTIFLISFHFCTHFHEYSPHAIIYHT